MQGWTTVTILSPFLYHDCNVGQDSRFCLLASNDTRFLPLFDDIYQLHLAFEPVQVLINSYQFQCCGRVTMWGAYIRPGGMEHTGSYSIAFQVWRGGSDGCYTLVGSNNFEAIELSGNLVQEVVSDKEQIEVQENDVIGYHLVYTGVVPVNVSQPGILLSDIYTTESVWYADSNNQQIDGLCPDPTSDRNNEDGLPLRMSTFNAPIITIGFCE